MKKIKRCRAREKVTQKITNKGAVEVNTAAREKEELYQQADKGRGLCKDRSTGSRPKTRRADQYRASQLPHPAGPAPPRLMRRGGRNGNGTPPNSAVLEHMTGGITRKASKKAARDTGQKPKQKEKSSRLPRQDPATPELERYIRK